MRDPDLPHVVLAVSQLDMYIGVALVIAELVIPRCDRFVARTT